MRICGGMSEQSKKAQFENAYIFHFCRVWKSDKKRKSSMIFFSWQNWPYSCTKDTTYSIGTFSFTCIPLIILTKTKKQPLPPLEQKLHILN